MQKNIAASFVERGRDATDNRMLQRFLSANPQNGRCGLRDRTGGNFHDRRIWIGFGVDFPLIGGREGRRREMKNCRVLRAARECAAQKIQTQP
jgi:hypothetical protein